MMVLRKVANRGPLKSPVSGKKLKYDGIEELRIITIGLLRVCQSVDILFVEFKSINGSIQFH